MKPIKTMTLKEIEEYLEEANQVIDFISDEINKPLPREIIIERIKYIIKNYPYDPKRT